MTSFLCERLEDPDCVSEVSNGLVALIQMGSFSSTNISVILEGLKALNVKSLSQNIRYHIFQVLDKLTRFKPELLGPNFITTYVDITSGEKDPRNLLISFSICHYILTQFNLGADDSNKQVGELFDVTFCYFPITFEPPKNDPYGITSDDLRLALRKNITANGLFAKDVIPGLIEKLNSSSQAIKTDALVTLLASLENYDPEAIAGVWTEIWDGVKFEVLHGSLEDDIAKISLQVLKQLGVSLLGSEDENVVRASSEYFSTSLKEGLDKLRDPQSKLALASAKLMAGIAQASPDTFLSFCEASFPVILSSLKDSPSVAVQRGVIELLMSFIEESTDGGGLSGYKDTIFALFSKSLMGSSASEVTLRLLALKGLLKIALLSNFLDEGEVGLVIQYFDEVALTEQNDDLRKEALNALVELGRIQSQLILDISFPAFLSQLPDEFTVETKDVITRVLNSLSAVSETSSTIFQVLIIRLLNKLDVVLTIDNSQFRYPLALISTLYSVLHSMEAAKQDLNAFYGTLLPALITKIVVAQQNSPLSHESIINTVGSIMTLIIRNIDSSKQQQVADDLFNLFMFSEPSQLISKGAIAPVTFHPLAENSSPTKIVSLFTHGMAGLRPQIVVRDTVNLLDRLIAIVSVSRDPYERLAYLRLIAIIINKWLAGEEKKEYISKLETEFKNIVENQSDDSLQALGQLELFSWVTKGLILKADNQSFGFIDKLVELLESKELGSYCGQLFGVVLMDDILLNKENYAVVRLLYKQRMFSYILPALVKGFKQTSGTSSTTRVNYLVALANILKHIPSTIVVPLLPEFLPLLLQSLSLEDAKVREAAIDTVYATLGEAQDVISQHMSTLVPNLLAASKKGRSNSVAVRIAALRCLGAFPATVEVKHLHPYKQTIIRELTIALDDPKREVRRAAVNCRQNYFEL